MNGLRSDFAVAAIVSTTRKRDDQQQSGEHF
jgi:hypothetical protein